MIEDLFPPTLDELLACIEREVKLRRRVYPRRVADGRMTQALAEKEIRRMENVADYLRDQKEKLK